jgi:hypothetical protein
MNGRVIRFCVALLASTMTLATSAMAARKTTLTIDYGAVCDGSTLFTQAAVKITNSTNVTNLPVPRQPRQAAADDI